MLAITLAVAATVLPPVIADPRGGPSSWLVVAADDPLPTVAADGYLLAHGGHATQAVIERIVSLTALGTPVVALGREPPALDLLPYLDGVALDPPPPLDLLARIASELKGAPLVCPASGAEEAVALLAAGASAVLVADPPSWWAEALTELLAEPRAARWDGDELATALRAGDLATVVGLATGFPGGEITLPGDWYGRVILGDGRELGTKRQPGSMLVVVPYLDGGGLLIALRPDDTGATVELLDVRSERLLSAAEVLARHHRAAARQDRLLVGWTARQSLLVRVWVEELARSFEVLLAGPVYAERSRGTDWEITEAFIEGVPWDPERLPELPLLEPRRPPVPPLALRLSPVFRYELDGVVSRRGRSCYVLSFTSAGESGGSSRAGTAWVDVASFGLVELEERAAGLAGEVRSSAATTVYEPHDVGAEQVWLPSRVTADDLVAVFGDSATVHRELSLEDVSLNPPGLDEARRAAHAGTLRMYRETPSGVLPLIPDGRGGRVPGGAGPQAQRFLIGGAVYDPGLSFPVPFGGLQMHDFRFRGRDEQLRLLIAGAVNDGSWTRRDGRHELTTRAFVQLLALPSSVSVGGQVQSGEEVELRRQRMAGGFGSAVGRLHVTIDLGVEHWSFGPTDDTRADFVVPADAWEGSVRVGGTWSLGAATLVASAQEGWRWGWRPWGAGGSEIPPATWRRGRLALVYERSPLFLARLHLSGELLVGAHLDRFSAFVPGRFGNLRLRGIAADRFAADGVAVARGGLALPLSLRLRGELGLDLAWVRERRSGYRARPFSGVSLGLAAPGPWGTLLELTVGYPLATAGPRGATAELFLLRPLERRR